MTGPAFDAWHLPGTAPAEIATLETGRLRCRYPAPDTALMEEAIRGLRDAGRALRARPVAELVGVVDAAAGRLADPGDPIRMEAERGVGAATGYSPEMTRLVLDRMTADWRADRLWTLLAAELPHPEVLDGFHDTDGGRAVRAYGPELAFQVFAGNVPGVAVTSLIRTLLVKAPTLGKVASGQPVLPVLFARAVASIDADAGRALAVTYWPGGQQEPERLAVDAADTVVVYGGEDVVRSFRERQRRGQRLVVHGPRFSAGLVASDAPGRDPAAVARQVARAVATFDQHGCVSPHAVWVEDRDGRTAADLAGAIAEALEALEAELPRGRVSPGEAAMIQQERAAAELRSHTPDGAGTRVFASDGTRWTVIFDPDPAFRASCLNRLVRVHAVPDLHDAIDRLAPVGAALQSVAIAGANPAHRRRLADRLARIGATRVTTFDRLPWPPPQWHHDGGQPIRELLRWVDLET